MNTAVYNGLMPEIIRTNLSPSYRLVYALLGSILLHLVLTFMIPNITFDRIKKPDILEIELIKQVVPVPIIPASMIKPIEPIQPIVTKPSKPITKTETLSTPQPTKLSTINESIPPIEPAKDIMSISPAVNIEPTLKVAPPAPFIEPVHAPTPTEYDLNEARNLYGHTLWSAIEKHKQYPRMAQMRGWQGEVIVEITLDNNGNIISKKILISSDHEVLDKQALTMVDKSAPFPIPPEILRSSTINIKVPIPFKLENP